MHDIEPFYRWRDKYISSEDERSPFYGRIYSEFEYSQTIYNYFIHPQWDNFGSSTLYLKILLVNYPQNYAIIELFGEWNDCLANDVMTLKREVIEPLQEEGITKLIIIAENLLTFHSSDDCYYEEWKEDMDEEGGWACFLNLQEHVEREFRMASVDHFIHMGEGFKNIMWQKLEVNHLYEMVENEIKHSSKILW